jgi:hypothetical protein
MNSQDFKAAILAKSPRFANSNQKVFDALANKLQRSGQFSQFGALYELFIYSFFIGIHVNSKIQLPDRKHTSEFAKIGAWKRDSPIINFILFIVFSRSEEIGFSWNQLEIMSEKELDEALRNIVTFLEEYAHGGLNYLKSKYEGDELESSQYLFIDLLDEVIEKLSDVNIDIQEDILQEHEEELSAEKIIEEQIKSGESTNIEFKSTLRVNMFTNKPDKSMEHSCMKTIAAFLNSNGGTLFIGIDDKKAILGLQNDLNSFNVNKDQFDEFQKHLDNLIESYFNNGIFSLLDISYPLIQEKMICVIKVKRSSKGEVLLCNKAESSKEEFYIRRSASTAILSATDMISYIRSNWT